MKAIFKTDVDFHRRKRKRRMASIIPLIDIAFFLLIFFMVAGTIEQFEIIDIQPPAAKSGEMLDEGHLVILLGRHDEIVMDDLLLNQEELTARLNAIFTLHPHKVVTIKADANVPAAKVIDIMDRVQMAGGKHLTIATDSEQNP